MKAIKFSILSLFILLTCTSCLKSNLDDLPAFEDSNIVSVQRVEYRYTSTSVSVASGQNIVKFITLGQKATIDKDAHSISIAVTVPAATTSFTAEERAKVATSNIAVLLQVSTAATITPSNGSPQLGIPGDWSTAHKYIVKAANGTQQEWTINVTSLTK